ncbi:hypothetical protein M5K25_016584 [Dendrobium thyrsiflorum]|uniref:Secreted protein n=1 Tax=Dendrobium thyrsiflorum TaxID=117978 RepID=A0ABD0UKK2_DENTH
MKCSLPIIFSDALLAQLIGLLPFSFLSVYLTMASKSESRDCFSWAARDTSGVLSPYKFNRRFKIDIVFHFHSERTRKETRAKRVRQERH